MQKYKIIIMFFVFLTGFSTILNSQPLSGDQKTWWTDNIMKPGVNMIFLMEMGEDTLDLDKLPDGQTIKKGENLPDNEVEIKKYMLSHKYEAEPYIRLYNLFAYQERNKEAIQILTSGLSKILKKLKTESHNLDLVKEAIAIYEAVDATEEAKALLSYFVKVNPKNAPAIVCLAMYETITMDIRAARSHIDQAYALEPSLIDIYTAETMYALYQGLIALNSMTGTPSLSISTEFLELAEQEHPGLEAPRLARHGLELFRILSSAIIRHTDDFKSLQPFKFILDDQDKKKLRESKAYFQKLLIANKKNDFYIRKCLIIAAVIEGSQKTALTMYDKVRFYPCADNDLFRLMSIGELTLARFENAITHMIRSIKLHDNIDDRLLLARFYYETGNTDASFKTLMQYKGSPDEKLLTGKFAYALIAGKIKEAIVLHQSLITIEHLTKRRDLSYYSGVLQLLQGKREMAKQSFKTLPEKNRFHENVQIILKHFKLL